MNEIKEITKNLFNYVFDPYGMSAIVCQLTGFLFLENVKMEKQRTNLSYKKIIPHFLTPKTFINGFFPYGALQAYSKGFIFGLNHMYVRPVIETFSFRSQTTNMLVGFSTGISEALLTSPLIYKRLYLNKKITEKDSVIPSFDLKKIVKGSAVLVAKRTIDWSTRFMMIDMVKEATHSYENAKGTWLDTKGFSVASGAALSSLLSAPIDRLLPVMYTDQSFIQTLRTQGVSFFYKGFTMRCLSTVHYTTILLLLPEFFK
jgi:hypothetical protein